MAKVKESDDQCSAALAQVDELKQERDDARQSSEKWELEVKELNHVIFAKDQLIEQLRGMVDQLQIKLENR